MQMEDCRHRKFCTRLGAEVVSLRLKCSDTSVFLCSLGLTYLECSGSVIQVCGSIPRLASTQISSSQMLFPIHWVSDCNSYQAWRNRCLHGRTGTKELQLYAHRRSQAIKRSLLQSNYHTIEATRPCEVLGDNIVSMPIERVTKRMYN